MYSSFNARALGLNLSSRETIDLAAETGFGGVDFLMRDLMDEGVDPTEIRQRLDDRGLKAGAFSLPVDWRGDADRFAGDMGRLPRYAGMAAILGAMRTGTWVMPETIVPVRSSVDLDSAVAMTTELHIHRLGAIGRILGDYGIQLGLEVIGPESFRSGRGAPFVTRLDELDQYLGAIWRESPYIGILLDGFHLYAAGEEIEAGFAWGVDQVAWVHVADLPADTPPDRRAIQDHDRGLPGENGAIDSGRLLRRLMAAGYPGPVTAEPGAGCRSLKDRSAKDVANLVAAAMRSIWPSPSP